MTKFREFLVEKRQFSQFIASDFSGVAVAVNILLDQIKSLDTRSVYGLILGFLIALVYDSLRKYFAFQINSFGNLMLKAF